MFEDEYGIEILLKTILIDYFILWKQKRSFTRLENNGNGRILDDRETLRERCEDSSCIVEI